MSLKMQLLLRMHLTSSEEIREFVFSLLYGMPTILRQDLDCRSLGEEIQSASEENEFLIYFSIFCRSEFKEILLVVITIPLFSTQIKSTIVFELIPLRAQLMLMTCILESLINFLLRSMLIGTMTCLREGPFVVILILGLGLLLGLLMIFQTRLIFVLERLENISLIFNMSLIISNKSIEEVFLDIDKA